MAQLYGRDGHPIAKSGGSKANATFGSIGSTGLREFGGWLLEEWDPALRGLQGKKVIREMADSHPIIGGVLYAIEMLCRQVGYSMEPGTDDKAGEDAAEFVEDCLHDMSISFEDKIGEIISGMLPYGWQLHETNFKKRDGSKSRFTDGKIGWADWQIRGQETVRRWEFDPTDESLLGMWQIGAPDFREHYIPLTKALLFRTTAKKGNPEGFSLLRRAYVPYRFQKQIQLIEAIGIERDLAGLPYARIPSTIINSTATEDVQTYQSWQQMVTNMRRNEQDGMVIPSDRDEHGQLRYEVGLLTSGGTRQFDTDKVISRYDERIAISMLAGFIMLGLNNVGSNALGQTLGEMFTTSLAAFLGSIVATINEMAIPRLLALNGMDTDTPPKLVHGRLEREDKVQLAQALQLISAASSRGAGIELDGRMDGPLAKYIAEAFGLPEPPDPQEIGYQVSNPAQGQDSIAQLPGAKDANALTLIQTRSTVTPENAKHQAPAAPEPAIAGSTRPKTAAESNGHSKAEREAIRANGHKILKPAFADLMAEILADGN